MSEELDLRGIHYAAYDPKTGEVTQTGNMARHAIERLAKENGWTWTEIERPVDYRHFRIDIATKKPVSKDDPHR